MNYELGSGEVGKWEVGSGEVGKCGEVGKWGSGHLAEISLKP